MIVYAKLNFLLTFLKGRNMKTESTKHKAQDETPLDKAQRIDEVQSRVRRVLHGTGKVFRCTAGWLWQHKKPILTNVAWLGLGTMLGAVRVIPPPANLVKLGLFRIAK